jgi:uncharacterized heparinase superfamily protein
MRDARGRLRWYVARAQAMSAEEVVWRMALPIQRRLSTGPRTRPVQWTDPGWRSAVQRLLDASGDHAGDAGRVAAGELEFWGRRVVCDLVRPAWDADPLDGRPVASWRRESHDWKPIWELHRQQHLVPLAAGGRREWSEIAAAQLLDWIERNPPGNGPGWSSGYETAHRLVGWAFAFPFLADHAGSNALDLISRSYAAQAAFASERPSRYSSANNHRLAELAGLLAAVRLGALELPWDELWRELEDEADRQTYSDGGSREQAAGYFLYVLEILWTAAFIARSAGRPLGRLTERLNAMLSWLAAVADEAGEPPRFGDDAEDRFLRLDYFEPRRAAAIAVRVRMLLGTDEASTANSESTLLPDSGYAVLRSRVKSGSARVVFDVGDLGYGSLAAHGHADALSLVVDVGGRPVLRDSGSATYVAGERREFDRGTAAHSTVVVDERSQAEPLGPHLWGRRFRTRLEAASLEHQIDYVRASHDGFSDATHTRAVTFVKPALLVVVDRIRGARDAGVEAVWTAEPGVELSVAGIPEPARRADAVPYSPRYTWSESRPRTIFSTRGRDVVLATALALDGSAEPVVLRHDGTTDIAVGGVRIRETWSAPSPEVGVG